MSLSNSAHLKQYNQNPLNNSINNQSSLPYLVVILSGPGEDLFPLVNAHSTDQHPITPQVSKPSLPILNKPMIEYNLDWIEESGLTDVLILASESQRTSINSILKSRKSSNPTRLSSSTNSTNSHPHLQIRLECIPDRQLKRDGTTGTLRWAISSGLIRTAFVIVPCDLYFHSKPSSSLSTNTNETKSTSIHSRSLLHLIEKHRSSQNLLTSVYYQRSSSSLDTKDSPPLTLVTLDPKSSTLLDIKEIGQDLSLRRKLLNRFPTPVLTTSLLPTHLYLCSSLVVQLLANSLEDQLRSFKIDFVPWLAKSQWQPGLIDLHLKPEKKKTIKPTPDEQWISLKRSTTNPNPIPFQPSPKLIRTPLLTAPPSPAKNHERVHSPFPNHHYESFKVSSGFDEGHPTLLKDQLRDGWKCEILVWELEHGFVGRCNSLSGYVEANRIALKSYEEEMKKNHQKVVGMGYGIDSCIGSNVVIGDKSLIKKSIVGKFSKIGKASKVMNSIIMEKVMIGENVKIENCVLADGVRIGDRAQLKDCEVGAGTIIEDDLVCKGERITDSDL
ncbi:uncharacterized protein MELLADRAFT_84152 [Melampsora larici-populina 98AG31]|uniref:Translation initiation factor eIF2B subunit gamma n=1 Tax=Melampsora larici-populina (strain 98AG31 / pathotype 3-4-7) TaxID=747676 RepID=F4SBP5_MELLP|nr:uncharacterized protein MELLADRAFT_84152 [Melampsora larici-populina 98AG31]EGF97937.1 hypothetical protein MELLADRAFT_84152 [Melampsora larici-populina 98AG31]